MQALSDPVSSPTIVIRGQPLDHLPKDLYIPPHAMAVLLESFSGPLDLLLYLIRKHDLDILDIPMATISEQYIKYIDLMQDFEITLAAEYLLMAAMLTEIKSRMLLPRPTVNEEGEEEDPRAELVRRLQEYERFKSAADGLDALPRIGRDVEAVHAVQIEGEPERPPAEPDLSALIAALQAVMLRVDQNAQHQISHEQLSIRGRMTEVLERLQGMKASMVFDALFDIREGRLGVVVTFVALLELAKAHLIDLVQVDAKASIYVQLSPAYTEESDDVE